MSAYRPSLIIMSLLLAGCISRGLDTEMTSCTYPDSVRTPAPSFICTQAIDGFPVTRLVSVAASQDPTSDRIEQGRLEVQQQLTHAWMEEWFADLEGADAKAAESMIDEWLEEELRVIRTRTSPAGTLWLLAGVPDTTEAIQKHLRLRLVAAGISPQQR